MFMWARLARDPGGDLTAHRPAGVAPGVTPRPFVTQGVTPAGVLPAIGQPEVGHGLWLNDGTHVQ